MSVQTQENKKKSAGQKAFMVIVPLFVVVFFIAVIVISNGYAGQGQKKNSFGGIGAAKHSVSTEILDESVSNCRYSVGPFSITVAELVNSAMESYNLEYLQGEEIVDAGYLSRSSIDSSSDINDWYCAIISGNVMTNPELPYLTTYEDKAVVVLMQFDENDNLINSSLQLCQNMQTFAILVTTNG